jgi:hypothetical protein
MACELEPLGLNRLHRKGCGFIGINRRVHRALAKILCCRSAAVMENEGGWYRSRDMHT